MAESAPKHIGLIGGIGPAATEFYYRGLVDAFDAAGKVMDLTIVHADAHEMVRNATAGDPGKQADIFAGFAGRLKAAGADCVVVTSMGGHFCIDAFEPISPLPVINGVTALNAHLNLSGLNRVGLLGTRFVMETGVYGKVSGIDLVRPPDSDIAAVHEAYVGMATAGRVTDDQRSILLGAGRQMMEDQNADAIVLAGTDLFLALEGVEPGYPTIDAAELHIAAIFAAATA